MICLRLLTIMITKESYKTYDWKGYKRSLKNRKEEREKGGG